mmetsp:Transcript_23406/g.71975  ORF Transcript_23406/g.71975 Transcript_23406/m.71975 type:complete len:112 (+) Transcript_23406:48-383(+)
MRPALAAAAHGLLRGGHHRNLQEDEKNDSSPGEYVVFLYVCVGISFLRILLHCKVLSDRNARLRERARRDGDVMLVQQPPMAVATVAEFQQVPGDDDDPPEALPVANATLV